MFMWVSCISDSDLKKKKEIATDAWFVVFSFQGGIVWKTVEEYKMCHVLMGDSW